MTCMNDKNLSIDKVMGSYQNGYWQFNRENFLNIVTKYIQNNSYVIIWFNHQVLWGRYNSNSFQWAAYSIPDWEQFIEARVFNQDEELWVGYSAWRYRNDKDGNAKCEIIDSTGRMWGEFAQIQNGFATLVDEKRKLKLCIPANGENNYYELKIRSYINYDSITGQAGYSDYRYLDIREGENNNAKYE